MALRESVITGTMSLVRSAGRAMGLRLLVEPSDHSIEVKMVVPDTEERAWDDSLYKYGNIIPKDYANPIKVIVDENPNLDQKDTAELEESDENPGVEGKAYLIASQRYHKFMQNDLISQLLNPKERWRLIAYGVIAVGAINLVTLMAALAAAGVI